MKWPFEDHQRHVRGCRVSPSWSPSTSRQLSTSLTTCYERWLAHMFGIKVPALSWIKSYLDGRSCFVKVGSATSTKSRLDTGVRRGSVLGPLLFSLFTTPLGDVISWYGIQFHQYVDDTQIYLAISNDSCPKTVLNLAGCTDAVYEWLLHNSLALNPNKSEIAVWNCSGSWHFEELCIGRHHQCVNRTLQPCQKSECNI